MKNYLSTREQISKIISAFAMILVMVAIAYYYLINLTSDLRWVMMCGYLFLAIPATFVLLHGISAKRPDVSLLSIGFVVLGVLGFVAKLFHGVNELTLYSYFYAAAYSISTIFVFSFADKIAFGKRLLSKWWFVVVMLVFGVVPTVLLYTMPDNTASLLIIIRNGAYILVNILAFAVGVLCILKKKELNFSWAYTIYAFLTATAYVFQFFGKVSWYNVFLMLAVVASPYVLMFAVKSKE